MTAKTHVIELDPRSAICDLITHVDVVTAGRVETALSAASRTSLALNNPYVKAGISAIALGSSSVTRIRGMQAAAAGGKPSTTRTTGRAVNDAQFPACMRT